jgi:Flp pilus assembly pilin Flp
LAGCPVGALPAGLQVEAERMTSLLLMMERCLRDRGGVAAAEYAILTVGIVIVVGVAVVTLNDPNTSAFVVLRSTIASTMTSMADNLPAVR